MKPFVLFLILPLLSSCFRPQTEMLRVELPEVESAEELELIRTHLLDSQEPLPEPVSFYSDILIVLDPAPALEIEFFTRHAGKQNVLHRIHRLGYTVDVRPGDPQRRIAFLAQSLAP